MSDLYTRLRKAEIDQRMAALLVSSPENVCDSSGAADEALPLEIEIVTGPETMNNQRRVAPAEAER